MPTDNKDSKSTIETAKDVAGVIPVIGGVLAGIVSIASSLGIKTKTTHLSWNEADKLARPYADNMIGALKGAYGLDEQQALTLWQKYQARMTGFIASSDWWDAPTRSLYWNAFTYQLPRDTQFNSLWYCFWLSSHWVYENIDGTHIETEGSDKLKFLGSQVLAPAMVDTGLITATEKAAVSGAPDVPVKQTTGPSGAVNAASMFGSLGDQKTLLVIGGVVLLVVAAVYARKGA